MADTSYFVKKTGDDQLRGSRSSVYRFIAARSNDSARSLAIPVLDRRPLERRRVLLSLGVTVHVGEAELAGVIPGNRYEITCFSRSAGTTGRVCTHELRVREPA